MARQNYKSAVPTCDSHGSHSPLLSEEISLQWYLPYIIQNRLDTEKGDVYKISRCPRGQVAGLRTKPAGKKLKRVPPQTTVHRDKHQARPSAGGR